MLRVQPIKSVMQLIMHVASVCIVVTVSMRLEIPGVTGLTGLCSYAFT